MPNSDSWSEYEYSKLKLLKKRGKTERIFQVLDGYTSFDDTPPISVELHLTDACNLKCPWCTDAQLKENKATLSIEHILPMFDYFAKNNVGVTIEGGGEPTLHPQFEHIVRYGYDRGLHMGIISNGLLDFSHLLTMFRWARISIDGTNAMEYQREKGLDRFDLAMKNLASLAQRTQRDKTNLGVGYVLTRHNGANLLSFIDRLNDMGLDYIYIRPVEESLTLRSSLEDLVSIKESLFNHDMNWRLRVMFNVFDRIVENNDGMPCVAHSLSAIIQANGQIVLCEKRRHDKIVLGSLQENSFKDIWQSDYRRSVCKKLLSAESQMGCATCRITPFNRMFMELNSIKTINFI